MTQKPHMTEAERAWHRTRRMFVYKDDKLHLAPLGVPPGTPIFGGMIPGPLGERWKAQVLITGIPYYR